MYQLGAKGDTVWFSRLWSIDKEHYFLFIFQLVKNIYMAVFSCWELLLRDKINCRLTVSGLTDREWNKRQWEGNWSAFRVNWMTDIDCLSLHFASLFMAAACTELMPLSPTTSTIYHSLSSHCCSSSGRFEHMCRINRTDPIHLLISDLGRFSILYPEKFECNNKAM